MIPTAKDMTVSFSLKDENDSRIRRLLSEVYQALEEKGYNPVEHIIGYLLSDDPTYITNNKNARSLIRKVERDEIINTLLKDYLGL
jgi:uncharacterized protein (UPF0297 family)